MTQVNREKLQNIKLLILDVDGVLTDGKIVYTDSGEQIKAFDVKDGHGLKLLMRSGAEVVLITGRESKVVLHRARDLGIQEVYQKVTNKIEIYEKILKEKNLEDIHVGFVGDDLIELNYFYYVVHETAPRGLL